MRSESWQNSSLSSIDECHSFVILFILFVVAIEFAEKERLITAEILFMVYALGFTLEKVAAMQEHGMQGQHHSEFLVGFNKSENFTVYFKGTWVR
jgi:hypothetical protein